MFMIIDTYKDKKQQPVESQLAKAFKDGSYQTSLNALLKPSSKSIFNLLKK